MADLGSSATGAWFAANDPLAVPFRTRDSMVAVRLGWVNGSSAGGNIDIGIYDASFSRIVSAGSTVGTGSNLWQWVDITDTALQPGTKYYLAMSLDNVTANRIRRYGLAVAGAIAYAGTQDSSTDAHPLPSTLTNMAEAATAVQLPVMAIACRTPFV